MATTLYSIPYSPWSMRARWALDHHRIPHRSREWVPLLTEPVLRARLLHRGPMSAPCLVSDGEVIVDSFAIARWAEQHGSGTPLMPEEYGRAVQTWEDLSQRMTAAGRELVTARLLGDPAALAENVPGSPTGILRPVGSAIGRLGATFIKRRYDLGQTSGAAQVGIIRAGLSAFADALRDRPYLLEGFSWADIAMACALNVVEPVDHPTVRLGERSRVAWSNPDLAIQFRPLLEWRDRIFAEHRDRR